MTALKNTYGCTHPGTDSVLCGFVFPVAHDHLTFHMETGKNMTVFSVTVSCLILIHKIHINGIVWDFTIILCMQMKQRFSQFLKAEDPGFCR